MFPFAPCAYAGWRAAVPIALALRETREGDPSESLLHRIWHHQRLKRDGLASLDGVPLRILHPGFWNREPGPDFRAAVVRIGSGAAQTGDVEIDRRASDWHGHGHDRNPAFQKVLLHVVWCAGAERSPLPTLVLESRLDASLAELIDWADFAPAEPSGTAGRCATVLAALPPAGLAELLQQAAAVRFRARASMLAARAREEGWTAALWGGLLGALGYKQNAWPMRQIAAAVPRIRLPSGDPDLTALQARLLGIGGLLPHDTDPRGRSGGAYLRQLWDYWWREAGGFDDLRIPPSLWRWSALRPANHPERRLALASHWLARPDLPRQLDEWFASQGSASQLAASLRQSLQAGPDEFWDSHWTLRSSRMEQPRPLLGAERVTDIAMNALLPWFWARAGAGGNEAWQRRALDRYLAWPEAQDNAVLRLARMRLLGGASRRRVFTAAEQQGLLQIVRDFCSQSNALCQGCPFPAHAGRGG